MSLYRKLPVTIEAFQWTGGHDQIEDPIWCVEAIKSGKITFATKLGGVKCQNCKKYLEDYQCACGTGPATICWYEPKDETVPENFGAEAVTMKIHTLEGVMTVEPGDYIIKGVKGELYPCKPDIFEATYEEEINERKTV